MKRILFIIFAATGLALAASAQPRALGVRTGATGIEMSYQHTMQQRSFIEAELGSEFGVYDGFKATGTYNFIFARPAWTERGYWGLYTGPGMTLGCLDNKFLVAFCANAGIEYTFWFPLQLSVDIRPTYGSLGGEFHSHGNWGFFPSVAARYRF